VATYEYTKTYGDSGALHATIAASLSGLLGVTWDSETLPGHDGNLDVEFESELSVADKTTLDSIVENFGS